jgi:DtxR family Mn-dependent transcriptional regulator
MKDYISIHRNNDVYMTTPLSAPAEDCLLRIHRLEERAETASTSGLARALGVTDSTVTAMVQKLAKRKLVLHKPRKEIALTKQGSSLATKLIRRHRLIETYLYEQLGYSWDEVHAEAEQLEHVVSDRFVDAIDKKLHHPQFDPHGDPIPTAEGLEPVRQLVALTTLTEAATGIVARVYEKSPETLIYLAQLRLVPGARVRVTAVPLQDELIHITVNGAECVLSRELASLIMLDLKSPRPSAKPARRSA